MTITRRPPSLGPTHVARYGALSRASPLTSLPLFFLSLSLSRPLPQPLQAHASVMSVLLIPRLRPVIKARIIVNLRFNYMRRVQSKVISVVDKPLV